MNTSQAHEMTYRYAAFGASVKVTLTEKSVCTELRSYLGRNVESLPLSTLSPQYETMTEKPTLQYAYWFVAISLILLGASGITPSAPRSELLTSVLLLSCGVAIAWFSSRRRTTEWIKFVAHDGRSAVCFARRGPDRGAFDAFAAKIVDSIMQNGSAISPRPKGHTSIGGGADTGDDESPPVAM